MDALVKKYSTIALCVVFSSFLTAVTPVGTAPKGANLGLPINSGASFCSGTISRIGCVYNNGVGVQITNNCSTTGNFTVVVKPDDQPVCFSQAVSIPANSSVSLGAYLTAGDVAFYIQLYKDGSLVESRTIIVDDSFTPWRCTSGCTIFC
jgi:hypothetical protein